MDPTRPEKLGVRLGSDVGPHTHVHRRGNQQWAPGRQGQRAQKIVSQPDSDLRQRVGCRGGNDQEIGSVRQSHVGDVCGQAVSWP